VRGQEAWPGDELGFGGDNPACSRSLSFPLPCHHGPAVLQAVTGPATCMNRHCGERITRLHMPGHKWQGNVHKAKRSGGVEGRREGAEHAGC
jgi:hypothetical protein